MAAGGVLMHVASAVRNSSGQITGAVVASDYLSGDLAERARRMSKAYEDYTQLRVLKQPLAGVYISFFVMVTLLILVGSTWMGLYLAKRITRPVQMLSEAAREIGAGHYDHRIEHEGSDEFGSMVDAFNAMAAEVAQSRRRLERASIDLEKKHDEGEGRRRYIEAILERIATGVVSIDRSGRIGTINPSALRLLELTDEVIGGAAVDVFARADLAPDQRGARPGRARQDGFVRAGSGAGTRRARTARRRCGDAHCRYRWRLRRHRPGRGRCHAADSRAEGGGLARGRAPAGA